ncbi:hypothetical protein C8F01DRAFT_1354162 [Mycena amicta]|nr:hypothetical protein C8F01DRAFT_1354162 [Mycena amicta]
MSADLSESSRVRRELSGTLSCSCKPWKQTGKTCEHIYAIRLAEANGPVETFLELETIRKAHGPAARGQQNNPVKMTLGREPQRRSDEEVMKDVERYYDQANTETVRNKTKGSTRKDQEDDSEEKTKTDIVKSKGKAGRPAKTAPMQVWRKPATKRCVQFSRAPGPKPNPHKNSLLPSPAKKSSNAHKASKPETMTAVSVFDKLQKELLKQHFEANEREDLETELHFFDDTDDLSRWLRSSYKMRDDEMLGWAELLAAFFLRGDSAMVLPRHALWREMASALRVVDWSLPRNILVQRINNGTISDVAQCLQSGGRFQEIHKSLGDTKPLSTIYLQHNLDHHDCDHWLLFAYFNGKIVCLEPLKSHGSIVNKATVVDDMLLVGGYFDGLPSCPQHKKKDLDYEAICLGVQNDASACGFWAVILGLLHVVGIDIYSSSDAVVVKMRSVGIAVLKPLLHDIWISFYSDNDTGLRAKPLLALLEVLGVAETVQINLTSEDELIAKRPSSNSGTKFSISSGGEAGKMPTIQLHGDVNTVPLRIVEHQLESSTDLYFRMLHGDLQLKPRSSMKHLSLSWLLALDVARLLGLSRSGWLNDDIINAWVDHLRNLHAERQPRVIIQASFLALQIQRAINAYNQAEKPTKEMEAECWKTLFKGTRKWFTLDLQAIVMPVNVLDSGHWFVVYINFEHKSILVLDSWANNANNGPNSDAGPNGQVIKYVGLWLYMEYKRRKVEFNADEWTIGNDLKDQPVQTNTTDCGVFTCLAMEFCMGLNPLTSKYTAPNTLLVECLRILNALVEMRELAAPSERSSSPAPALATVPSSRSPSPLLALSPKLVLEAESGDSQLPPVEDLQDPNSKPEPAAKSPISSPLSSPPRSPPAVLPVVTLPIALRRGRRIQKVQEKGRR